MRWVKKTAGFVLALAATYAVFLQLSMLVSHSHLFRGATVIVLPVVILLEVTVICLGIRWLRS